MAMESAAAKRHASLTSVQTCDKAVLVSKAEEYLKTPRSSIGIQVRDRVTHQAALYAKPTCCVYVKTSELLHRLLHRLS